MSGDGRDSGGLPTPVIGLPRRPPVSRKSSSTNSIARLWGGNPLSRPSSPGPSSAMGWNKDYLGSAGDPSPIPGTPSAPGTRASSPVRGSAANLRQPLVENGDYVADPGLDSPLADTPPVTPGSRLPLRLPPQQVVDSPFDEVDEEDEGIDAIRMKRLDTPTKSDDHDDQTLSVPQLSRRRSSVAVPRTNSDFGIDSSMIQSQASRALPQYPKWFWRNTVPALKRIFLPSEPDESELEQQAAAMKNQRATNDATGEPDAPPAPAGRPVMLPNTTAEVLFVMVCSCGQGLFSHLLGHVVVITIVLTNRLNMATDQMPWLNGAFLLANGLSVTISGSLADIYGARVMIVGSLAWLTMANALGAILMIPSVAGSSAIAFCVARALQGLGIGGMTSSSISYLGRVYKPGVRRNRVFSAMAGVSPCGYVTGGLHSAALQNHLPWLFGSMAMVTALLFFAALKAAPTERNMLRFERMTGVRVLPKRKFDLIGASLAIIGCGLIIFGLTQGSSAQWAPYTYTTLIIGILTLGAFVFAETRVQDPLVPPTLWSIKSFAPMSLSYFMCFGSFSAAQVYGVRFWQDIQGRNALQAALMLVPNAIVGVTATFCVARLFHVLDGQYILGASCLAAMLLPMFFILNHPSTNYFLLSMWGIGLSTFSPDLSFAACSLFISNSVSRRYQGVASSILITMQNLSGALLTSLSETVGTAVEQKGYTVLTVPEQFRNIGLYNTTWLGPGHHTVHGDGVTLNKLHAIWLFCLSGAGVSLLICVIFLRIPKGEERDHQD